MLSTIHRRCFTLLQLNNTKVRLFSSEHGKLHKTILYDTHVSIGGKMVPYAGYQLPLQYKDSIIASHQHTRSSSSIFDVSHMGQLKLYGNKRGEFLETIVPSNILELKINQCRLSSLLNSNGGIIDDCMITQFDDCIGIVVNGACKDKDIQHIRQHIREFNKKHNADIELELISNTHELLALQGPKSERVLNKLIDDRSIELKHMNFMHSKQLSIAGVQCQVSRCGYTGEDGFELSVPKQHTVKLYNELISHDEVLPAGLAVRDSLRIEAALCLYGNEMNEDITPIEAGLKFTIQKRRREQGGFLGYDKIKQQIDNGTDIERIGFIITGKAPPARQGADILLADSGDKIGYVTSGIHSPTLNQVIGMGYVNTKLSKVDTKIKLVVRNKQYDGIIVKMPFVTAKYHKAPLPQQQAPAAA